MTPDPGADMGAIRLSERVRARQVRRGAVHRQPPSRAVGAISSQGGYPGRLVAAAAPCRVIHLPADEEPQLPGAPLQGVDVAPRAAWGRLCPWPESRWPSCPARGVSCQPVAGGSAAQPARGQQQPRHHPHRSFSCAHPFGERPAPKHIRAPVSHTGRGCTSPHCPAPRWKYLCSPGLFIRD